MSTNSLTNITQCTVHSPLTLSLSLREHTTMPGGPQQDRDNSTKVGSSTNNENQSSFANRTHLPVTSTQLLQTGAVGNPAERTLYETENTKLRKEKTFLSNQLLRLTAELRGFQIAYPYANVESSQQVSGVDLPQWMTSEQVLSPLLSAYDSRIQELSAVTEKQRQALDEFGEQCEQLVAENELLRERQLGDLRTALEGGEGATGGATGGRGMGSFNNEGMVSDLEERVSILMQENSLMAEQGAILSKELESSQGSIMEREQVSGRGRAKRRAKRLGAERRDRVLSAERPNSAARSAPVDCAKLRVRGILNSAARFFSTSLAPANLTPPEHNILDHQSGRRCQGDGGARGRERAAQIRQERLREPAAGRQRPPDGC